MNAQHTPGPWFRNIRAGGKYPTVFSGRDQHVAHVVQQADPAETEANIDLIAAAPDLLAALAELIAIDEWMVLVGGTEGPVAHEHIEQAARRRLPAIEAARAAIAKATGKMP